jgi:membrane protease YdiL (CAAX protease family)
MKLYLYHAAARLPANARNESFLREILWYSFPSSRESFYMDTTPSANESASVSSLFQPVFFNPRGLRAGWRLLIFGGIVYGFFFAVLRGIAYLQNVAKQASPAGQAPTAEQLQFALPIFQGLFLFAGFGFVLLMTWAMSRLEQRSVGVYGLPLTRARAVPQLASGLMLGFFLLLVTLAVLRVLRVFYFGTLGLHGSPILIWGLLWGFGFLAVGFFEEFSFRGYALYTLADGIGFWPAAIIMGLVFGRAHMGNGGETYIGIAQTILFALLASAMLRRTGSLWLPVGVHAGWDWGQSYFFGVNDSGFQAPGHLLNPQVQGPSWLSGGTVGPEGSVVTSIVLILATVAFLAFYRERREPALVVISAESSGVSPP